MIDDENGRRVVDEAVRRLLASRDEQHLPEHVEDPVILDQVVTLLGNDHYYQNKPPETVTEPERAVAEAVRRVLVARAREESVNHVEIAYVMAATRISDALPPRGFSYVMADPDDDHQDALRYLRILRGVASRRANDWAEYVSELDGMISDLNGRPRDVERKAAEAEREQERATKRGLTGR